MRNKKLSIVKKKAEVHTSVKRNLTYMSKDSCVQDLPKLAYLRWCLQPRPCLELGFGAIGPGLWDSKAS